MKKPKVLSITREQWKAIEDCSSIFHGVCPVKEWIRGGYFDSIEEAAGAIKLAYEQAMDGCGSSVEAWMGITPEERVVFMNYEGERVLAEKWWPKSESEES